MQFAAQHKPRQTATKVASSFEIKSIFMEISDGEKKS